MILVIRKLYFKLIVYFVLNVLQRKGVRVGNLYTVLCEIYAYHIHRLLLY